MTRAMRSCLDVFVSLRSRWAGVLLFRGLGPLVETGACVRGGAYLGLLGKLQPGHCERCVRYVRCGVG